MEENTLAYWRHETNATPPPPALITKKWLCIHFGLMRSGGSIYYEGLYKKVLTPEVIERMGCTPEEIRDSRLRTFNRLQTLKLIEILGL